MCEYKNGDNFPTVLALVKKNSRGLRRGYVINAEETLESVRVALADAERITKLKIKKVVLGIGGATLESKLIDGSVSVSRPDAEINSLEITRAMESAEATLPDATNRNIIHRLPISFKLDNKKVLGRVEGLRGNKLEVKTLFVTCSSQHLRDLIKVVEEAGIIVDDIVASPLAASYAVLSKLQKVSGCVLVNIGSQTTSIAVFEENLPISIQVFPLGSTDITNDIALGFRIPLEDAERVKRGEAEGTIAKKKLDDIIHARLSDIFEYVEGHLKKIGCSGLLPAGVVITGGGSGIGNIEELAKNYFKLPAKISSPEIATNSKNQIKESVWSVAYGLCLYDIDEDNEKGGMQKSHHTPMVFSVVKNIFRELWP
ncbi:MAG: Cell division protein ftsA [Parcubacteria group bacterium GW2011_GWC1_43_11b]|uniref:Cell division protein FtsA n=2 Tax=Candidatus Vogeliibacteriota TaxID=1817922 RepID=A0A1G2QCN2_9BACT|nr:MAG: Cell division protein ftsA [Parcubacteria group bacterium GW2011_GWC1_43_11b]KKT09878.1 MAG: Cell division protein ftsA [Parcubacteria group bacterium GW2011_GWA1_43_21]OHA58173.1 MAG: cell division protein FtsA [Candidatus Vogelbacteria bacterium RIFOXYB1_FULL_42_16]OHA59202.1 MAG: cell division protein FtsA [Candidatus Vogelbacteria bacterium RIFOXYD1_FULL_42_15]